MSRFETIRFTVPGVPVPQPRQKHRIVYPKGWRSPGGPMPYTQNYVPAGDPVHAYKQAIVMLARARYRGPALKIPFSVKIRLRFPRQKNKVWKTKPMPVYEHTATPDPDNVQKAICDALNGVIWHDDSYIGHVDILKHRVAGGQEPGTYVEIRELIFSG